jgi:hypothetical protein
MTDQADPQGEQIINCPFCDEDPKQPGHYIVGRWVIDRPGGVVSQVALTCVHALPDKHKDTWLPWTWFLSERPTPDKSLKKEAEHEPRILLTADDEAWARRLGEQMNGEEAP